MKRHCGKFDSPCLLLEQTKRENVVSFCEKPQLLSYEAGARNSLNPRKSFEIQYRWRHRSCGASRGSQFFRDSAGAAGREVLSFI